MSGEYEQFFAEILPPKIEGAYEIEKVESYPKNKVFSQKPLSKPNQDSNLPLEAKKWVFLY